MPQSPIPQVEKRTLPSNQQLLPPQISGILTTPTTIIRHIMPHNFNLQQLQQQRKTTNPPPLVATSVTKNTTVNTEQAQSILVHSIRQSANSPPINVISPANVPVTNFLTNNPSMPSLNTNVSIITTSAEQTK